MLKYIFHLVSGRGPRGNLCKANVMKTLVLLKHSRYVSLYLMNFDCSYGTMRQFINTRFFTVECKHFRCTVARARLVECGISHLTSIPLWTKSVRTAHNTSSQYSIHSMGPVST